MRGSGKVSAWARFWNYTGTTCFSWPGHRSICTCRAAWMPPTWCRRRSWTPAAISAGERELLGWLRQILVCNVARAVQKQIGAQKRDARREISIERQLADLERSSARVEAALVSPLSSPSMQAQRRERIALIADHLARLPNDYREVIVLRNLESLPFAEVARRMGRTSGAVRVLWVRALDQFRQLLEEEGLR